MTKKKKEEKVICPYAKDCKAVVCRHIVPHPPHEFVFGDGPCTETEFKCVHRPELKLRVCVVVD